WFCHVGDRRSNHAVELRRNGSADLQIDRYRGAGCLDLGKADGRITQHACGGQRQRATRLDRDRALQRPVARNRLITSSSLEGADVQAKARTEARIRPGERLKDQHVIAGSRVRHPATERNRAAELVSQLSPPESVVVRWIHAQYEAGMVVIGVGVAYSPGLA